jgi:chloride channel protein, CIC family
VAAAQVRDGEGVAAFHSLATGASAAIGAIALRRLIEASTGFFSGRADFAAAVGDRANPHVPWLGPWFLLLACPA